MLKILLPLLMAWACEKPKPFLPPEPVEPDTTYKGKLDMVWKAKFDSSGVRGESQQPLMYGEKLLWNAAPHPHGFSVMLSDAKTGKVEWEWSNFLKYPIIHWNNHQFIHGHYYAMQNNGETNVIDLNDGTTVWQFFSNDNEPNIWNVGDYLYANHSKGSGSSTEFVKLVRSPVSYMDWETIYTIYTDSIGGYVSTMNGPTLWMSPSGDSIFLWQNRSYNFATSDGQIDLYAYNFSKQGIEWIMEDIEPVGGSNVLAPVVEGDRCYVLGERNLQCFDLVNRKMLWQKGFPGFGHHLKLSNLIIDGNRLIVKPDNDAIHALDKMTGDNLWSTFEAGTSPSHMQLWNGMVFYTSEAKGKIYAVKTSNGEIVWAEDSPHDGNSKYPAAGFDNGVAIHAGLGYIYVHDHHFMMCFKLPGR